MKQKGFTLIELLAVIVILAIIALIAVPIIMDVIGKAKKGSFLASAYHIVDAATLEYMAITEEGISGTIGYQYRDYVEASTIATSSLKYKGQKPFSGDILVNHSGEVSIALTNGVICAKKGYNESNIIVTESTDESCDLGLGYIDSSGANAPELSEGMIPVIWESSTSRWVKADYRQKWYSYNEKMWANAVLVNNASRSGYQEADPGQVIEYGDILAHLVWIPRYQYRLFNVNSDIISADTIEMEFKHRNQPKSNGNTNGGWLTHPGFTFGNEEKNGFWIGKFETTGTSTAPTIKPYLAGISGQQSVAIGNQNVSQQFQTSTLFTGTNNYGLTSINDSHVSKNTEWGAVAYLTRSIYGQNSKLRLNDNNVGYTGCAASAVPTGGVGSTGIATCANEYHTTTGVLASTTGNVYGVYDMSGGRADLVMGIMRNQSGDGFSLALSGFDPAVINSPPFSKYVDAYSYDADNDTISFDPSRRILGDAVSEALHWEGSVTRFIHYNNSGSAAYPIFYRGGLFAYGTESSIFGAYAYTGQAVSSYGMRTVLFGENQLD